MTENCPLCDAGSAPYLPQLGLIGGREFWRCECCGLVFVARGYLPPPEREKARYLTHQNTPENLGYRAFLNRLLEPLLSRLSVGASGLDYGAGPGRTLATMCEEKGFRMALYDPFFHPTSGVAPSVFSGTYDFITCSEAVEHFHFPRTEFERLAALVRPGGWVGVMTQFLEDEIFFPNWYYQRDDTHVSFYHRRTFGWLAERFDWEVEFAGKGVVLFRSRPGR